MMGDGRTHRARRALGLVVWLVFVLSLIAFAPPVVPGGGFGGHHPKADGSGSPGLPDWGPADLRLEAAGPVPGILPGVPDVEAKSLPEPGKDTWVGLRPAPDAELAALSPASHVGESDPVAGGTRTTGMPTGPPTSSSLS